MPQTGLNGTEFRMNPGACRQDDVILCGMAGTAPTGQGWSGM